MSRRRRRTPDRRFTCERCGGDAGPVGITCDPCQVGVMETLLASAAWREQAADRLGDVPGETLLETITRQHAALAAEIGDRI